MYLIVLQSRASIEWKIMKKLALAFVFNYDCKYVFETLIKGICSAIFWVQLNIERKNSENSQLNIYIQQVKFSRLSTYFF